MKMITEQLNGFIADKYGWSALLTGEKITIKNKKGQICGAVAIAGGTLDVQNVMLGQQNLMGSLAKKEIRIYVQGLLAGMIDAAII